MNSDGRIYRAPEGKIPLEDKARLDGYLRGLAQRDYEGQLVDREAKVAELMAKLGGED